MPFRFLFCFFFFPPSGRCDFSPHSPDVASSLAAPWLFCRSLRRVFSSVLESPPLLRFSGFLLCPALYSLRLHGPLSPSRVPFLSLFCACPLFLVLACVFPLGFCLCPSALCRRAVGFLICGFSRSPPLPFLSRLGFRHRRRICPCLPGVPSFSSPGSSLPPLSGGLHRRLVESASFLLPLRLVSSSLFWPRLASRLCYLGLSVRRCAAPVYCVSRPPRVPALSRSGLRRDTPRVPRSWLGARWAFLGAPPPLLPPVLGRPRAR